MHPKGLQEPTRTILRCYYFMAPFATSERGRPGRSRRSTEISKVIGEALSNAVFMEDYPKTATDIFMEILQANASTRCAALNAASMALADAGIPMRDIVSSLSVGKVDGKIVLDVAGAEDNFGDVDMAVATIGRTGRFVLLQVDGVLTLQELRQMLELAKKGCAEVRAKQREALLKRYSTTEVSE
jgi:exosome complex component RRP41